MLIVEKDDKKTTGKAFTWVVTLSGKKNKRKKAVLPRANSGFRPFFMTLTSALFSKWMIMDQNVFIGRNLPQFKFCAIAPVSE
ncbi:hypothetical protein Y032_0222g2595 [Ancylostoma ceylanicum]|uniref:Uncharacterized protein n=1 Tax=Ancylostoma ceylanicum TaxID=53326 RepID=A0A016SHL2_9BILA|nr:hypothetical protein Y032_0222g2595 [Ancylostoma ceylanicum]